jgi:hypothetical protein
MKRIALVCVVLLTVLGGIAIAQDVSLGDVVRQQKPSKKAAHVITNDDLPLRSDDNSASSDASAAPDEAATADSKVKDAKDASASSDKPNDDKTAKEDSPEVKAVKSRLDQVNTDIAHLQENRKGVETQLANENDDERRAILENVIKNQTFSLEHGQVERDELNEKLKDLQKPKPE